MEPKTNKWIEMASTDFGVAKHLFETYYPKPLKSSAIIVSNVLRKRSRQS